MSKGYLYQFKNHIKSGDYPSFLILWEEYCMGDEPDGEELRAILKMVKDSDIAKQFGRHVEYCISLWEKIKSSSIGDEILMLILDLETTNTQSLATIATNYLSCHHSGDNHYNDKIRLVGLRDCKEFNGAIRNYKLLTHISVGNFVFHNGGWGVGEILDLSFLREQVTVKFDYISGNKDISFQNSFKTLIPLSKEHFLVRRFSDPDKLEDLARKDPLKVIHILIRDLGPSTSYDIKKELCDLVIPREAWGRWWQVARARLRKDPIIEFPKSASKPFKLRDVKIDYEERFQSELRKKLDVNALINMVYGHLRDFPHSLKNVDLKARLEACINEALSNKDLSDGQVLQLYFFLEDLSDGKSYLPSQEFIKRLPSVRDTIDDIDIVAFKKRMLVVILSVRNDWEEVFLDLLLMIDQHNLKDYILMELLKSDNAHEKISTKIETVLNFSYRYYKTLFWYFQKIMKNSSIPYGDANGKSRFLEVFLTSLIQLEGSPDNKSFIKQMYKFIVSGRYSNIRKIFKVSSKSEIKEFLLLATKCQSLSKHDVQIFYSLANVVHPSISKMGGKQSVKDEGVIWTSESGYNKIKNRLQKLSTVDMVDVAKEIEIARSHGDLRENAEFKAAVERKNRIQGEIQSISKDLNKGRILTKNDIPNETVGVGTVVELKDEQGNVVSYTILGPWDADPEDNILSFQSKLACSLIGLKVGSKVSIRGENMVIISLNNYLER